MQRLTQGYTDGLLQIFPPRVAALGKALGLEGERVQVKLDRSPLQHEHWNQQPLAYQGQKGTKTVICLLVPGGFLTYRGHGQAQ